MDVNDVSNSLVLHDDGQLLKHKELKGIEAPSSIVTSLKEHQKQALEFMTLREKKEFKSCLGGMLLDDAGLGKSLVILSLICNGLKEKKSACKLERVTSN
jgi:SNF2 family DNA or RNA helicase